MDLGYGQTHPGLLEDRAGWARTDLYTDITMTTFDQNPIQANKT